MMVKVSFSKGCFFVPESLVPILNTFIGNYIFEGTKQLPSKQQTPSPHPDLKVAIYLSSEENSGATQQSMK